MTLAQGLRTKMNAVHNPNLKAGEDMNDFPKTAALLKSRAILSRESRFFHGVSMEGEINGDSHELRPWSVSKLLRTLQAEIRDCHHLFPDPRPRVKVAARYRKFVTVTIF